MAAGFLTGNFVNSQHQGTRMSDGNPRGKLIQKVFGDAELHQAVARFDASIKTQGLSSLEVAIRWIVHHSALGDQDSVILGASKEAQLRESVSLIQKGPLPSPVLALVEELWAAVEPVRSNVL